jgi:hypothetical protein
MPAVERKLLEDFGRLWVKYIKEEAWKDAQKSTFMPRDKAFYDSFEYKIEKSGVVSLYSSWPYLDIITEGTKGPYRMKWLTREKGVDMVPLAQADGRIVFRTTPLTIGKAWVHPKIAAHTFITRAYDRALEETFDGVVEGVFNAITSKR